MKDERQPAANLDRLPHEALDRLTKPLGRFLHVEAAGGAILLLFALIALVLSNSAWARQFSSIWETRIGIQLGSLEASRPLRGWINDGLMTLFFFVVALELKRELVLGELRSPRMAALSIAAALGGMVVPAGVYLILQWGQPGQHGWGTVMATDTAFVVGCLALLGSRIPQSLRVFMLSSAIADDIGAIVVVAIAYGGPPRWGAVAMALTGIAIVRAMGMLGVRSMPAYCLAGAVVWLAVDASGIHATAAGVILGLLTPTRRWVSDQRLQAIFSRVVVHPAGDHLSRTADDRRALRLAEVAVRETASPVERLELALHPWIGFAVMPLFALANAGIPISGADLGHPVTGAVFLGLVLGKPIGVVTFSWLAVKSGVAMRPASLDWGMLSAGALLAGIGFTMALFIANLAFSPNTIDAAKVGILCASVVSAVSGLGALIWLSSWRIRRGA